MKKCRKCNETKPLESFNASKVVKGGYRARCRACIAREYKERSERRRQAREAGLIALPEKKQCGTCGEAKLLSEFNCKAVSPDGRAHECRLCAGTYQARYREYYQQRYQDDKERIRAVNRDWIERNKEHLRQYAKEYCARNRERRATNNRAWYARNGDLARQRAFDYRQPRLARHRMYEQNRRARIEGNGGTYTEQEWQALCAHYDYRCLRCGETFPYERLTVDHVIPVSKGGPNDIYNLQPLCLPCNSSKQTKTIDYRPVVAVVWPLLQLLGSGHSITAII